MKIKLGPRLKLHMSNRVFLADGVSFDVTSGETILNSAREKDIVLEHSCRNGSCGVCKAKVVSGDTYKLSDEISLTDQDVEAKMILTCCRAVKSDVRLDIESLGDFANIKTQTVPAKIDSIRFLSADVVEVVLRTPPATCLEFIAGQYVDVIGSGGLRRSYSLANAPRNDGRLFLEIRRIEGGRFSEYWFEHAQINDLLRVEGPLGTFCLRPNPIKNLIFLATGTGIAPIKSILQGLSNIPSEEAQFTEKIQLYWGARNLQDLYWTPEFPSLPLRYSPVLSQSPGWGGRTGYVQHALLSDEIDLTGSAVYACGSEKMIRSAKNLLVKAGLDEKSFYSDAFVTSGTI